MVVEGTPGVALMMPSFDLCRRNDVTASQVILMKLTLGGGCTFERRLRTD